MNIKIPSGMHQFEDERALLVTTGKQIGRIFFTRNGTVREMDGAFEPTPKYSDREGFFSRGGKGKTYGSGAPYEPKDTETKRKFIRAFCPKIKDAIRKNNADVIYLFSPDYAITELKECLGKRTSHMIRYSFMGNFVKFGPMDLIEKIGSKLGDLKDKNEVLKPEETKILAGAKTRHQAVNAKRS